MSVIEHLPGLALAAVVSTTASVLLIAALRVPVQRYCGAIASLQLWWILPLSLLVMLVPKHEVIFLEQSTPTAPLPTTATVVNVVAAGGWGWVEFTVGLWLTGACLTAAYLIWRQRQFMNRITWSAPASGGSRRVGILPEGESPAMVGAISPQLVLPQDFHVRYTREQRRLILLHEHIHRHRRDGIARLAMSFLVATQWFNPAVHWAARTLGRDQESACDALIVQRHPGRARAYAEALLKSIAAPSIHLPAVCHWQAYHPTVERIAMLKQHRQRHLPLRVATITLIAGAALSAGATYAMRPATQMWITAPAISKADARKDAVVIATVPTTQMVALSPGNTTKRSVAPTAQKAVVTSAQRPASVAAAGTTPTVQAVSNATPDAAPNEIRYKIAVALTRTVKSDNDPPAYSIKKAEFVVVVGDGKTFTTELPNDMRLSMKASPVEDKIRVEAIIESLPEMKVRARPVLIVLPGAKGLVQIGKTGIETDVVELEFTVTIMGSDEAAAPTGTAKS